MTLSTKNWKRGAAGAALVAALLGVGTLLVNDTAANAATTAASTVADTVDQSRSQRADEHLLTGTDATKVSDAALAAYPGATIQRVETDSDGVYEAHVVTAAGEELIVQVGSDFTVTGTQPGGGHRGGCGGGPDADGDTTTGG